jgi:hypothetical protein
MKGLQGLQTGNNLLSTGTKRKISHESLETTDDCLRFKINLFKSTEKTYPEIDINELIKSKREIINKQKTTISTTKTNGSESQVTFVPCVDDARKLAEEFEKKYGNASAFSKKKKGKQKIDDYLDAGFGYDKEDTFVDDTDCYDVNVPAWLDTPQRGFYINDSGVNKLKLVKREVEEDLDIEDALERRAKYDPETDELRSKKVEDKKEDGKKVDSKKTDGQTVQNGAEVQNGHKNNEIKITKKKPKKMIVKEISDKPGNKPTKPVKPTKPSQPKKHKIDKDSTDDEIPLASLKNNAKTIEKLNKSTDDDEIPLAALKIKENFKPKSKPNSRPNSTGPEKIQKPQTNSNSTTNPSSDLSKKLQNLAKLVAIEMVPQLHDYDKSTSQSAGKFSRTFIWSNHSKLSLAEVVHERLMNMPEKFKTIGFEGTLMWLKNWLDSDVKVLWPKGWMQARVLLKVSKEVHRKFTGFGMVSKLPDKDENSLKVSSEVVDLTTSPNIDSTILQNSQPTQPAKPAKLVQKSTNFELRHNHATGDVDIYMNSSFLPQAEFLTMVSNGLIKFEDLQPLMARLEEERLKQEAQKNSTETSQKTAKRKLKSQNGSKNGSQNGASNKQNGNHTISQNGSQIQNGARVAAQPQLNGQQFSQANEAKNVRDAFILQQAAKDKANREKREFELQKAELARRQQQFELEQSLMNEQAAKQSIESSLTSNSTAILSPSAARTATFNYKRSPQRNQQHGGQQQQGQYVQVPQNNVITLSPSQMNELQVLAQQGGISLHQLQSIQGTNLNNVFTQKQTNDSSSSQNDNGQYKF